MKKRLIIIDGNAILHRAFHALPPLTNKSGEYTNAIYGFISILFKVIEDLIPTYLAVTFDRPKPTFRKQMYKEYQAKRPEMDVNLVPQIGKVHDVLKAMDIPIYEKDGFEADDVIATLAKQSLQIPNSKNQTIDEIVIVTGDRDLLQLVDDKVKLFMPVKGLSEGKLFGEKETLGRMGVRPEQIPDFKALAGDNSDNYPGVSGIGPKTAVNLIQQFGTIDNIYKNLDKIVSINIKQKLIKDKDNALMSYKLATIVKNVPIRFDLENAKAHDLGTQKAIKLFGDLGFKTHLKRLLNMGSKKVNDDTIKSTEKKAEKNQLELFLK
jgi:DNA polymerase-1